MNLANQDTAQKIVGNGSSYAYRVLYLLLPLLVQITIHKSIMDQSNDSPQVALSLNGASNKWGKLKLAINTTSAFLHPATASVGESIAIGSRRQSLLPRPVSQPPSSSLLSNTILYCHLALFGMLGCFIRILIEENTELFGKSN